MIITKKHLKRRIKEMYPGDETKQTGIYNETVTMPRLKWETHLEKIRFNEKFGSAMSDAVNAVNQTEPDRHVDDDPHRTHNDSHAI